MKTITAKSVLKWIKRKPNKSRFQWSNCPACLFTRFVRETSKCKKAYCDIYGNIRVEEKPGFIAKVPFHDLFWCEAGRDSISKRKAVKILTNL